MAIERRKVNLDDARLSTQRVVTYALLVIFAAVAAAVFVGSDQAERSTILQTVINLTLIAVGFWLGSSKEAADKGAAMSRIAEASAPVKPIKADEVEAAGAVTVERKDP